MSLLSLYLFHRRARTARKRRVGPRKLKGQGKLSLNKPFVTEVSDFGENYILLLTSKLYERAKLLYYF